MPETRTGKRKEHSLDADELDGLYTGTGSQSCAHAQKQQKHPLAGDAFFEQPPAYIHMNASYAFDSGFGMSHRQT